VSRGVWYGIAANIAWGLTPIYWKQLDRVPAPVLIGHRVFWSFLLLGGLVLLFRPRYRFASAQPLRRVVLVSVVAAVLICANWTTYVWAVTADFIVEASLGYFITPLVSVGLGVLVLGERLRPGQWAAVGVAAVGLLYLTTAVGRLPWIALVLAGTFGVYGLVKKTAPLGAVQGLTAETGLLFLPAAALLLWGPDGSESDQLAGATGSLFMLGSGVLTIVPLVLFASSVRLIPLSHLGIIQYLAPTLQFLLAVFLYGEPFSQTQLVGYGLVWAALALFGAEGLYARRALSMPASVP
jgi:chloramphenicol-sensitive protein RarD